MASPKYPPSPSAQPLSERRAPARPQRSVRIVSPMRSGGLGRRIGGYRLLELLGRGGMADVYRASAELAGRCSVVAIKVLQRKWAVDAHLRAMFRTEAHLAAQLDHPNLVKVFEEGEHVGSPYMVMELVNGVSCAKLLRAVATKGIEFPPAAALTIASEVLKGLSHAHQARDSRSQHLGIVHRDVSPGNVLIDHAGRVKLTDFGIALSKSNEHDTDPGQVKGKFGYMSPEQVAGDTELDARSDLFSLGVVLTEMLLGRRLFAGTGEYDQLTRMYEANTQVLDDEAHKLDPRVLCVLRRALHRERDKRFGSAVAFLHAIETAADNLELVLGDSALLPWLHNLNAMPKGSGTYALSLPDASEPTTPDGSG